jgi:hypothetical protein
MRGNGMVWHLIGNLHDFADRLAVCPTRGANLPYSRPKVNLMGQIHASNMKHMHDNPHDKL